MGSTHVEKDFVSSKEYEVFGQDAFLSSLAFEGFFEQMLRYIL